MISIMVLEFLEQFPIRHVKAKVVAHAIRSGGLAHFFQRVPEARIATCQGRDLVTVHPDGKEKRVVCDACETELAPDQYTITGFV